MADWEDPSLEITENRRSINWYEHFWPKFEIQGFMEDSMGARSPDFDATKPKYKPDLLHHRALEEICITGHRASLTLKWTGMIFTRIDDGTFPFDSHALEISVKVLGFGPKKNLKRPKLCHPHRWRSREGHELKINGDIIDGFTICRLAAKAYSSRYGPFITDDERKHIRKITDLYQDTYTLQM